MKLFLPASALNLEITLKEFRQDIAIRFNYCKFQLNMICSKANDPHGTY